MFIDARTLSVAETLAADVCIIGAGPAGLTLAREFMGTSCKVLLVESGGLLETADPALLELEFSSEDFDSPNLARRRQFAGMVNDWDTVLPRRRVGAKYLPLDPIDFEHRDWLPYSGWPFDYVTLQPYYDLARHRLGLPSRLQKAAAPPRGGGLRFEGDSLVTSFSYIGPQRYFTHDTRDAISRSGTVRALLHATAVELCIEPASNSVRELIVTWPHGRRLAVQARCFVLAAGAVENARLLLASSAGRGGLGNARGLVGRFYMDHPYVTGGTLRPAQQSLFDRIPVYDIGERAGALFSGKLAVHQTVMRRQHLLNSVTALEPRLNRKQAARADAFEALTRGRLSRERRALAGTIAYAAFTVTPLALRYWRARPNPQYGWSRLRANGGRFDRFVLIHQCEQAPHPDNRVTLSQRSDMLGMPVPHLQWNWSDADLCSLRRVQALIAREMMRNGIGVLDRAVFTQRPQLLISHGAHHHLGTTRMNRDPSQGVVNAAGQVHEVPNLFVAGGSVFPTGGCANPTLTVVALALRLADHLKRQLSSGPVAPSAR